VLLCGPIRLLHLPKQTLVLVLPHFKLALRTLDLAEKLLVLNDGSRKGMCEEDG
jgi:hypothetical protein